MLFGTRPNGRARLPLKWGAGLAVILAAFAMDDPVAGSLQLHSKGWAWSLALFLSQFGDWPPILLAGLLCVLFLFLRHKFEPSRLLLLVLVAGMLSGLSATIIRGVAGRTRPSSQMPQGFYGPRHDSRWIIDKYEFGSFPSGHTATVAGLAAAACLLHRRLGAVAAVFAAAVAWSRVALNCHHFSDVVASAVWGIFSGPWIFRVAEMRIRGRWAILQDRWLKK